MAFLRGRSTASPLFIIRRLLEIHERHGISFYALFLDWAQAFDSVSHEALKTSLTRIGLPPHYVNCVMAIYASATFRVREGSTLSNSYSFKRGIRQGCPLSPCLFIIVLSVLFEDLYSSFRSLFQVLPSVLSFDKPITDIEYADDTLLVARTAQALNRLLHLLQYLARLRTARRRSACSRAWRRPWAGDILSTVICRARSSCCGKRQPSASFSKQSSRKFWWSMWWNAQRTTP